MGTRMWGAFKNEVKVFGHGTYFLMFRKFDDTAFTMIGFDRWHEAWKTHDAMGKEGYIGALF